MYGRFLMSPYFTSGNAIKKQSFLKTGRLYLVDQKGSVESTDDSLKQRYYPDVLSRRTYALIFDVDSVLWGAQENIDVTWVGFPLFGLREEWRVNNSLPIDINEADQFELPAGSILINQDLGAIVEWTKAYAINTHEKGERIIWPEPGTWPNWPDIEFNGRTIKCCSEEKALIRDRALPRQLVSGGQGSRTAAAQRALGLSSLKL